MDAGGGPDINCSARAGEVGTDASEGFQLGTHADICC